MVKVNFHIIRNFSGSKFFPLRKVSGSEFFPLRKIPILKREAIEENHCLIQSSLPLMCLAFSGLWLHHCNSLNSYAQNMAKLQCSAC